MTTPIEMETANSMVDIKCCAESAGKKSSTTGEDICFKTVEVDQGGGMSGGIFNVANAALGAGLLAVPQAFQRIGSLPLAIFFQIVFASLTFMGLYILGLAAKVTASDSYALIVRRLSGRSTEVATIGFKILFCWGVTISFLIVLYNQVAALEKLQEGDTPWYANPKITTTIASTVIVFPVLFLRSLDRLQWISFIAISSCIYVALFVTISWIVDVSGNFVEVERRDDTLCTKNDIDARQYKGFTSDQDTEWTFPDFLAAFPAIAFGYQCHLSSIQNYSSLKRSVQDKYSRIAAAGTVICFLTYTFTGMAGSLLFKKCILSVVLSNYSSDYLLANIGRILTSLAVLFSYPILFQTGRHEILRLYDRISSSNEWHAGESNIFCGTLNRRINWITIGWFISSVLVAVFLREFKHVLNVIGSLSGFWMFIWPGIFALKLANIMHTDTIDETLAKLPDKPEEELADSWTNGVRLRLNWLTNKERIAMKVGGYVLIIFGSLLSVVGLACTIRDSLPQGK